MKKLLLMAFVTISLLAGNSAQAQKTRYYYYPQSNVYYDPGTKQYIYYDGTNWSTVRQLPGSISIQRSNRVSVYSDDREVWRRNEEHKVKYKNYPNGKAVGYKGTNPRRTEGKAVGYKGTNPNKAKGRSGHH